MQLALQSTCSLVRVRRNSCRSLFGHLRGGHFLLSKGEDTEAGERSAQQVNIPGSGSVHLLTPFKALSSVRFSFRMLLSNSRNLARD
ncbi:hypothetical protein TorRG33x02_000750 [Trema orientale]|uniref:Uncharacterized protein n=1 Tax=Trema orientale TaxID=63057 RepID=A0A2P5G174_TREOI|nr:hypothetical protein TorRG33x02_000750 [Trema orientale]